MRISFRELNEAIIHPRLFRRKLRGPQGPAPFFRYSYYNVLVNSIFHFHNYFNDPSEGENYLIEKLNAFKNEQRKEYIVDQFKWYVGDYLSKNITTFEVRQNIRILPEIPLKTDVTISGQISRIDIVPAGGYLAWVFRNRDSSGWVSEFSMPLIQYELANRILKVPNNEITIGIYSFTERVIEQHCYSEQELHDTKHNLEKLLKTLSIA